MSMLNRFMSFAVMMMAVSTQIAIAAEGTGPDHTPTLTWEQFKESCLHPEQFHSQVPPSNIRIQCTDKSQEFIAAAPGQLPLPGSRKVIYAVFSNKYHVNAEQKEDPAFRKGGSCTRYKEVERTMTVEKVLSCEDVLGIKSDLGEYCFSTLNLAKGSAAKLTDVRDTGRFVDTCSGPGMVPR